MVVPGAGRRDEAGPDGWFDVERFRSSTRRVVEVRRADRATLVLGSTQPVSDVDGPACASAGVVVARRRSGGGAVLVTPPDPVWCDVWVPRDDPLWEDDVRRAPWWVGTWWASALQGLGATGLSAHRGAMVSGPLSEVVCFAGLGPGEVTAGGRKVVGVAQWRCRQGALFHCAAYRRWEPSFLLGLLAPPDPPSPVAVGALDLVAVGVDDLLGRDESPSRIVDALIGALPPGPPWLVRRD